MHSLLPFVGRACRDQHPSPEDCSRTRDDRGDVPGWVMVTVMTAGLVVMLWKFVGPELRSMLGSALNSVS